MKHGNRPILTGDDFAMACIALGFAAGMVTLAAVGLLVVICAAMFAPIAIAIATVAYLIEVIAF